MYIKNLETAEMLPYRLSMRKGSDYDSWDCYHICGRGYYTWLWRFIGKHVGESFDDVFSLFKKFLKKKKVNSEDFRSLTDYFLDEVLYSQRYRWYMYYVDEDGLIQKKERTKKSGDKVIKIGEPETKYLLSSEYKNLVEECLLLCFGRDKYYDMVKNGITSKEYLTETNEVKRFNNMCMEKKVKPWYHSYGCLSWYDIWRSYSVYPETVTLKYRSPEYRQYMAESLDKTRKHYRELYLEKVEQFNETEVNHHEKPILIG